MPSDNGANMSENEPTTDVPRGTKSPTPAESREAELCGRCGKPKVWLEGEWQCHNVMSRDERQAVLASALEPTQEPAI